MLRQVRSFAIFPLNYEFASLSEVPLAYCTRDLHHSVVVFRVALCARWRYRNERDIRERLRIYSATQNRRRFSDRLYFVPVFRESSFQRRFLEVADELIGGAVRIAVPRRVVHMKVAGISGIEIGVVGTRKIVHRR